MLLGCDRLFGHAFAAGHLWQALVVVIDHVIVAAFFVDAQETVKQHDLTGGAQFNLAIAAGDIDGCTLHPRTFHLAGDGAFPDQIIKLALVGVGDFRLGCVFRQLRRADTFVRFLGVLGFVFIDARVGWHVFSAILVSNCLARLGDRFGGHVDAIGPHIGDQAGLVQTLRGVHGHARAKAEFARSLLLQS